MTLSESDCARLAAVGIHMEENTPSLPMEQQSITQLLAIVNNDGRETHGTGPSRATRDHAMDLIEAKAAKQKTKKEKTPA